MPKNSDTQTPLYMNSVAQMLPQDELDVLYEYDSLTRTLKLLGAPLEPILEAGIESQFLRLSYTHLLSNVFKPISVKLFKQLM